MSKHRETPAKDELLKLFATYVYMVNPDYKYNETYLKDMIPAFWVDVETYYDRLLFCDKLLKTIQATKAEEGFSIEVDDTWKLASKERSRGKWQIMESEECKIKEVNAEKIYIKCHYTSRQGTVYSDYRVFDYLVSDHKGAGKEISDEQKKMIKFVTDFIDLYMNGPGE